MFPSPPLLTSIRVWEGRTYKNNISKVGQISWSTDKYFSALRALSIIIELLYLQPADHTNI